MSEINTSEIYIEAGRPWFFRPGPKITIEQLTRVCSEFDLVIDHDFRDNEVRLYQRDLNTTPPTGAQLAECMFGPGNTVTLVEEVERIEIGAGPVDMTGIEVLEIGKESELERARRLAK